MSAAVLETGWLVLALAAAVSSGTTLTFSSFVMPALDRVPAPEAARAMQRINEDAINPVFMAVFIGTGLALGVWGALAWAADLATTRQLAAAGLYIVGVVGVTAARNVPLNNALARLDAERVDERGWAGYARPWVRWNHLRTAASATSAALLLLG